MKKGVKIFIIVLVLILVAAVITAFLLFRYYPHITKLKRSPHSLRTSRKLTNLSGL